MKDNGLQSIASDIQKNSSIPIVKIIMAIIFIFPIIVHGFKWGWVYPVLGLLALVILSEVGVFGVILGIIIMLGSAWLCRWRVQKMRLHRKFENMAKLYTPYSMLDDDDD